MNTVVKIFFILIGIFSGYHAQTVVGAKADFVSRYIWRGIDFGNSFSIQPSLMFGSSGFEAGFWGSYPFTNTANGNEELDFSVSYSINSFSLLITDYYFPNSGIKLGKFKNPGAHTIEAGLSYGGSGLVPISISGFVNIYNDDNNSMYAELTYSTKVKDVNVYFFLGGGNHIYTVSGKFNLTNIGIKTSKEIKITDSFSLPLFCSYVLNPNTEKAYLIFGMGMGI